jgi:ABC-type uncharacterized transport system substrate-binding protein
MKNCILIALMVVSCITYAQKKTNVTIFVEHPAIKAVEAMTQAFVSGDANKVAPYLADDFKAFNVSFLSK